MSLLLLIFTNPLQQNKNTGHLSTHLQIIQSDYTVLPPVSAQFCSQSADPPRLQVPSWFLPGSHRPIGSGTSVLFYAGSGRSLLPRHTKHHISTRDLLRPEKYDPSLKLSYFELLSEFCIQVQFLLQIFTPTSVSTLQSHKQTDPLLHPLCTIQPPHVNREMSECFPHSNESHIHQGPSQTQHRLQPLKVNRGVCCVNK